MVLLLTIMLAACSGGRDRPPAPLVETHGYLIGTWSGMATSARAGSLGATTQVEVTISVSGDPQTFDVSVRSSSPCFGSLPGTMTIDASSSRTTNLGLRGDATATAETPAVRFVGEIFHSEYAIRGAYWVTATAGPCAGDFGDVSLRKTGGSLPLVVSRTVEIYELPGWAIVIQSAR